MDLEIKARVGSSDRRIFMQEGFFVLGKIETVVHKHIYPEIHIAFGGEIDFFVDAQTISLKSGDVLVIPQKLYHCCIRQDRDAKDIIFQLDIRIEDVIKYRASENIIQLFIAEIKRISQTCDYSKISAYISQ